MENNLLFWIPYLSICVFVILNRINHNLQYLSENPLSDETHTTFYQIAYFAIYYAILTVFLFGFYWLYRYAFSVLGIFLVLIIFIGMAIFICKQLVKRMLNKIMYFRETAKARQCIPKK